MDSDIIIALATPPSASALALLRVSGKGCLEIIRRMVRKEIPVRKATLAKLHDGERLLDEVVVTTWQAPSSYTGEDMVEICCHGNPLICDTIIKYWSRTGTRLARPGEFTQRSFLNGKMDLTQAEAVLDVIHAQSERSLKAAQSVLEGELKRIIFSQRESLLNLLAHIEAHIDFPEEDISPETGLIFTGKILTLLKSVTSLLDTAMEGKRLREGIRIALVGAPNSGKSSLLNILLGHDRAIVSDIPGTTRDTVEESLILEGIRVRLIDTAGLRDTPDAIEKLGMERTLQAAKDADLVIHLHDITLPLSELPPLDIPGNIPRILCLTKKDLLPLHQASLLEGDGLPISSLSGDGIDSLKQAIVEKLGLAASAADDRTLINTRHEILLRDVQHALEHALKASREKAAPELVSADLWQALRALAEIVGETSNEDVLDRLFSTFCIGK